MTLTREELDLRNLILADVNCRNVTSVSENCEDGSHFEFRCKPGYKFEINQDFFKAKCKFNKWENIPKCIFGI
jgi:hypothetical protein